MTVSVVIPAYNAGRYLRAAVESLLLEGTPNVEMIVVDDGSTDNSISTITDLPIRVITKPNGGEASARNVGVSEAKGDFITFLDADDLMIQGGILKRLEYLEKNPKESVVGGLIKSLIDENGEVVYSLLNSMMKKNPLTLTLSYYQEGNFFPVSCSLYMYSKTFLEKVGKYDENFGHAIDADFHYRTLQSTTVPILPVPIFSRRLHSSNESIRFSRGGKLHFNSKNVEMIEKVNSKYHIPSARIEPWENTYL